MTNTDNTFGVFNKTTTVYTQSAVSTFQLSATTGGAPITTTAGTLAGTFFALPDSTRFGAVIKDTQGNFFACGANNTVITFTKDLAVRIAGTNTGTGSITGYNGIDTTYYVIAFSNWQPTTFSTVDEAKSYFLTADALSVHDTYCTDLQWALTDDSQGLICTMDFGQKGLDDPTQENAAIYLLNFNTLLNARKWGANLYIAAPSTNHLF
jgi:hypothetical protein